MPRNRKDYTLRSSVNEPVSIEDYRAVPWRQTYTDTTVDFRRWLYIGRPELADDGSSLSVNNGETKPLVHAGRDGMVDALRNAVWHIPSVEAITKLSYCSKGITNWLEYLDCRDFSGQAVYELADIDKEVVQGFIHWLKFTKEVDTETGRLSYQTAKMHFSALKPVLQYLVRQGALPEEIFPRNPFPNSNRAYIGHKPYTKKVMSALMTALYLDIKGVREKALQLNKSDVLALYLLAISARTGRNTTPLLELTRDAVLPHPIKPDKLGLLVTYKRRGRNTSMQAFEKPLEIEEMTSLPMDVLSLYQEAVTMTEPLVAEAPLGERNRLWLYRRAGGHSGKVCCLSEDAMFYAVKRLVRRHGLSEDGKSLKLNISRLRKTFAQRIWQLSGGDLIVTAVQLGNTPTVADKSYVDVTPEMEANFRRLGILMHADWAGKLDDLALLEELARETGIPVDSLRDIAVDYNNTGVGRCTDPRYGARSPGDGSLCTRWLECFRCPNQLITESDLYRLFSFYFLLIKERNYISREKWDNLYAPIIRIIDGEIITPNLRTKENVKGCFDPYQVNKARVEAETNPHRMWQDRAMLGSMS